MWFFFSVELALVANANDSYLKHDHLEVHNEALYFRDFMARAAACGLEYLGESEFSTMVGAGISTAALSQLNAEIKDIIRLEQYLDFLRNRTFRMTLLVKQGQPIQRHVPDTALSTLWVAGQLTRAGDVPENMAAAEADASAVTFKTASGNGIKTGNPVTKAALMVLAACFPESIDFAGLLVATRHRLPATHSTRVSEAQDHATLAKDLMIAYMQPGLLRLDAVSLNMSKTP